MLFESLDRLHVLTNKRILIKHGQYIQFFANNKNFFVGSKKFKIKDTGVKPIQEVQKPNRLILNEYMNSAYGLSAKLKYGNTSKCNVGKYWNKNLTFHSDYLSYVWREIWGGGVHVFSTLVSSCLARCDLIIFFVW